MCCHLVDTPGNELLKLRIGEWQLDLTIQSIFLNISFITLTIHLIKSIKLKLHIKAIERYEYFDH